MLSWDAKGLKSGELLSFVVEGSTHAAVIVDAMKDKALVHLHGDRLEGKKVEKKAAKKAASPKKATAKTAS